MFLGKSTITINLKNLFFLLFIISSSIISQVNPDVAFYPLHVGDTWQYAVEEKLLGETKITHRYVNIKVVGTEIIEGRLYFGLTNSEIYGIRFFRIDSTDATIWEYKEGVDCLLDSLSMTEINDYFCYDCHGSVWFKGDTTKTVFSIQRNVKAFYYSEPLTCQYCMHREYLYAEGIGQIFSNTVNPAPVGYEAGYRIDSLVYAKIDKIEYGEYFPENINSDVAFYPLHIGDTWQYLVEYIYRDSAKDSSYYATVTVKGIDTLYGKTYYTITNSENWSLKHIRIDSTNATVWELLGEDECMIDSLSMGLGESFDSECYSIISVNEAVYSVFEEGRRVKTFTPTAILTGGLGQVILYKYGYGLGLIYSETTDITIEASSINRTLVYAKIDEVEYGQLPQEEFNYFPLQIGNKWIYLNSGYTYDPYDSMPNQTHFAYKVSFEITSDTVINGKKYYYCKDGQYSNYWLRTDSVTNSIYKRYDFTEDEECLLINLSAKTEEEFNICNGLQSNSFEADTLLWGENRFLKTFFIQSLSEYESKFVEGIGRVESKSSFDFGESTTLLLGCIINGVEYGQLPQEHLNYYPLDVGNYWEYNVYYGIDPIRTEYSGSYWVKVTGDTILANNKNYKILERGYFDNSVTDFSFERVDSATSSIYRSNGIVEYKIDSLACSEEDTIKCSRFDYTFNLETYCTRIAGRNIFNSEVKVKYLNDNSGIPNTEYELAENIGLIANYTWEGSSRNEYLQYAKIKNVEYGTPVDVKEINNSPIRFSLSQNYPNPFNPSTTIRYSIPGVVGTLSATSVQLKIYNTLGQEVAILVNKIERAGNYEVQFDASNLTSGIYFYKLQSGSFEVTKKLLLLK